MVIFVGGDLLDLTYSLGAKFWFGFVYVGACPTFSSNQGVC